MLNIDLSKLNLSGPIVIGVSTGSDSMALFHYMINNYKDTIICAHINHNVRKQSNTEELFLKDYCNSNNIIFETMKIDEYKENNFENEARKKRYNFYEQILNKYNSKYLLLAHHADDLIETILMKIIRGSSILGYAGIKKITKRNNYYIIRPLLDYTKEEILQYIKENNITYYEDITNKDTKYTRNRIRKNILPLLKNEDKNIHKKFILFSKTLNEYNDYLNNETNLIINKVYIDNKLNLILFNTYHPLIKKSILYKILNDIYKEDIITEKNIDNILNIINNKKPNITINLPKNINITKEYNYLIFNTNILNNDYKIEFIQEIEKDNWKIEKIENTNENGNNICRLNSKDIKLPLYIRNRKNGDKITLLGLNKEKKVKDIFIEKKIPLSLRNSYPLLIDSDNNILWIPNVKKSNFNRKNNEKCDIILRYCETKEENINE